MSVHFASACRAGVASTRKCEHRTNASRLVRRTSSCSARRDDA